MRSRKIILSLILSLGLVGCANEAEEVKENETIKTESENIEQEKFNSAIYEYFDTLTTTLFYAKDEEEYNKYKEIVEDDLKKYHELFNSYDDFEGINNIKTINENSGKKPVEVDPAIIDLLEYCLEMNEITNQKINIGMGRVLEVWHNYREAAITGKKEGKLPSDSELKEAAKHMSVESLEIDRENNTVFIKDPEVKINIGATGKGYATKIIEEDLRKAGLKSGIVSVGGDDVIIGTNPAKNDGKWKIAIQNPDLKSDDYSSIISVEDTSVVTSGDYQRNYTVDGKNYHHIIDPDTLYPSEHFKSVSVVHEDIALADTLSTYLFIIDQKEGLKVAEEYGAEVLWIDKDGKEYKTDGWKDIED